MSLDFPVSPWDTGTVGDRVGGEPEETMGREVRRVRPDWSHPTDDAGNFIPLYGTTFLQAWTAWEIGRRNWDKGRRQGFIEEAWEPSGEGSWEDWDGPSPRPDEHMPAESFGDWWMMYETCSEGTPVTDVSTPFATARSLAEYLERAGASFFGGETTTADHWEAIALGHDSGIAVFTRRATA